MPIYENDFVERTGGGDLHNMHEIVIKMVQYGDHS